jgi:hypothetical protein
MNGIAIVGDRLVRVAFKPRSTYRETSDPKPQMIVPVRDRVSMIPFLNIESMNLNECSIEK